MIPVFGVLCKLLKTNKQKNSVCHYQIIWHHTSAINHHILLSVHLLPAPSCLIRLSAGLTQATKNTASLGTNYQCDYFKDSPSVTLYFVMLHVKKILKQAENFGCQWPTCAMPMTVLGCFEGFFTTSRAFKTFKMLGRCGFTAYVYTSSLLCFSSFEMLSAGAISPTMHSAIS